MKDDFDILTTDEIALSSMCIEIMNNNKLWDKTVCTISASLARCSFPMVIHELVTVDYF